MAVIPLMGTRREAAGKGGARSTRRAGRIPGVLYGHGQAPVVLSVGYRDFETSLHGKLGSNPIVSLKLDGDGEFTALIREIQRDPVTHEIVHLDFQTISLTERIEVNVALHLVGTPLGVKDLGGVLESILREVKVRCLPTAIPGYLEVDVSHLGVGDSVHVRDIAIEHVEVLTDLDATVATVVPPTVHEEKPAEAVVPEAVAAEPELIAKGKKEEEGGEPEAEKQ